MSDFGFISRLCFLLIAISLPFLSTAQGDSTTPVHFEVNILNPYISVTTSQLQEAHTLADLNSHYNPEWVREYYSVEISGRQEGNLQKVSSTSDQLSAAQKAFIAMADPGTEIAVRIHYLPANTLIRNEAKVMTFNFIVQPEQAATYPGGVAKLNAYLEENLIRSIAPTAFTDYDLAAVTFTVTATGAINNIQLFESSKDEVIDTCLMETVASMPSWHPATYADGTPATQEFVLTIGNMENCMLHLLNIKRN